MNYDKITSDTGIQFSRLRKLFNRLATRGYGNVALTRFPFQCQDRFCIWRGGLMLGLTTCDFPWEVCKKWEVGDVNSTS